MRPRAWCATWLEIAHLVTDHLGEGLAILTRVIDPPESVRWVRQDVAPEDATTEDATYVIQLTPGAVRVGWCSTCLVSHAFLDMYVRPDEPPVATWADHNEEDTP